MNRLAFDHVQAMGSRAGEIPLAFVLRQRRAGDFRREL
jgi:hypothetical protein